MCVGLSWCLLLVVSSSLLVVSSSRSVFFSSRGVFFSSRGVFFSECLLLGVCPCGVSHEVSDLFPSVTPPRYHGSHRRRIDDVSVFLSVLVFFVSSSLSWLLLSGPMLARVPTSPVGATSGCATRRARAPGSTSAAAAPRFATVTRCSSEDSPTLTRTVRPRKNQARRAAAALRAHDHRQTAQGRGHAPRRHEHSEHRSAAVLVARGG
jgi:hypothetical protein